ncbi:MAG TPA: hypothetical protein VFI13_07615 [Gemmatimonadales bacterium]|nr:hypothetical protein [Gemmatimonadales bacterium]
MRLLPVVLTVLIAAPANAQFRLPKPRVPNPLNRGTSASNGPRTPTYDDRVLEITDARLTTLMRGLDAEQRQRPALETAYKKNADARAAYEASQRGAEGREEQVNTCLQASPEYRSVMSDTSTAAQTAMISRIQALQARGDYAAIKVISDSMAHRVAAHDSLLNAARARCEGGAAATPAPSVPPAAPAHSLADSIQILGAGASGMTVEQYAVMQERVLAYLNSDEGRTGSLYAYSDAEMTVLRNKRAQLQRYQATLTEH